VEDSKMEVFLTFLMGVFNVQLHGREKICIQICLKVIIRK